MIYRWGSKLIAAGDIDFYQFIVSFMAVYFSGQGCATTLTFASSKSQLFVSSYIFQRKLTLPRFHKGKCRCQLLLLAVRYQANRSRDRSKQGFSATEWLHVI